MSNENAVTLKGCFHLQIEDPDGTIVGDSGPVYNLVTLHGFQHMGLLYGTGLTGTRPGFINVGEGGAPATNATSLPSEVSGTSGAVQRQAPTASTEAGSKTLRYVATMASANSFVTATEDISNVGIFNHSDGSSLCAGAAYASSSVAVNQNVNITYDLVFETA